MWVCICLGVKDSDIARLVAQGFQSMDAIQQQTGLGTKCGKCKTLAGELIEDLTQAIRPITHESSAVKQWSPADGSMTGRD
ncbi:(2Fe-2S)-binding protein (plasmid) [Pseudomonas sp. FeN3W]|nr:(2Fe-2S)-binding protein [Pseudomonas sp. FeN3W]